MDGLTIVAISSAVGGLTGKFVEKAWDSGEKWIQNFYNNHNENVNKKARENSLKFLNELALRVDKLEQNEKLTKEKINESQNHPDFSALLEKAIMSSAQTDSNEKHIILARIVSERLKANPESILALNSKMAVDIISFLTVNQMKILGLLVNLYKIRPSNYPLNQVYSKNSYQLWLNGYLTHQLKPFQNLNISSINITHLESLSCIRFNKLSFSKKEINSIFKYQDFLFEFEKLSDHILSKRILSYWDFSLRNTDLTSVGELIGIYVSDILHQTNTKVNWE